MLTRVASPLIFFRRLFVGRQIKYDPLNITKYHQAFFVLIRVISWIVPFFDPAQIPCRRTGPKGELLTDDVVQRKESALLDNCSSESGSASFDQRTVTIRDDSRKGPCVGER